FAVRACPNVLLALAEPGRLAKPLPLHVRARYIVISCYGAHARQDVSHPGGWVPLPWFRRWDENRRASQGTIRARSTDPKGGTDDPRWSRSSLEILLYDGPGCNWAVSEIGPRSEQRSGF